MTSLVALCMVALIAFGLAVGCWDGVHRVAGWREAPMWRWKTQDLFPCACGARVPLRMGGPEASL